MTERAHDLTTIQQREHRNGMRYGILAGLFFSLGAWGYDAYVLHNAGIALPWAKLAIALPVAVLVGALVGWLRARIEKAAWGVLFWVAFAIGLTYLGVHLPFEGQSLAYRLLRPELSPFTEYPFPPLRQTMIAFAAVVLSFAFLIGGALQTVFVEGATNMASTLGQWLRLSVCLPIFLGTGIAADSLFNSNLRGPAQSAAYLLRYTIAHQGQEIDRQFYRDWHLSALRPLEGVIAEPFEQVWVGYSEDVETVRLLIRFPQAWAQCTLLLSDFSFCERVEVAGETITPIKVTLNPGGASVAQSTKPVHTPTPEATRVLPEAGLPLPPQLNGAPHYHLDLEVQYPEGSFRGRERLEYTNQEGVALDRLVFRLYPNATRPDPQHGLSVDEVRLGGQALPLELSQGDTLLEVPLPQPLAPGEKTQLDLTFTGKVTDGSGGESGGFGIFNLNEEILTLSAFYPLLAVYDEDGWNQDPISPIGDMVTADMSLYTVALTTTQTLTVAGTGVATRQEAGEQAVYHFATLPAREFFLAMSPAFEVVSKSMGDTTINVYSKAELKPVSEQVWQAAALTLKTFNEHFGPYPYSDLDVIASPMQHAIGVEFPGIVLVSARLYENPQNPTLVTTTAHEVAHQWWYNMVGNDVRQDPWLDEALTSYTTSLYFEAQGGGTPDGLLQNWRDRYAAAQESGMDAAINKPVDFFEGGENAGLYGPIVYGKGALFFHALRQEIGDEAFFAALQSYYAAQQYQIAQPDDLLNAFEEAAGHSLDDFYQKWLEPVNS